MSSKLRPWSIIAVAMALSFLPPLPSAAAADSDEAASEAKPKKKKKKKKTRRMLVESSKDAPDEAEEDAAPVPQVGDPPEVVNGYLLDLESDNREARERMKRANRSDDAEEALAARADWEDGKALYASERTRLTTQSPGMIAGGATLVGLGSVSFVASFVLVITWGLSGIDGYPDDEFGWGALGTLGGGVLGISVGAPLLAIGLQREPRSAEDAQVSPAFPRGYGSGLSLSWQF